MSLPPAHDDSRARPSRAWIALALVLLTVAAFCLRHTGVRALLPHMGEPHERVYATQVELLRSNVAHPELDSQFDYYPLLVARLALLTQPARDHAPASVEEHRLACGDDLAHLRTIIALLAALAVPATYAFARWFLAPGWSLLAAALYAASPLAILLGQQARPHAAVVGPIVAAVAAALLVRRRPVLVSYVLAGLALGMALAILHNAIAVVPALVVAHVLRDKSKQRQAWVGACAALAIAAAIALWTYPHGSIGVGSEAPSRAGAEAGEGAHFVFLDQFRGQGFAILARALRDYEPWLTALAAAGLAIWLVRRVRERDLARIRGREDRLVVAAWCVPYALVIGVYDISYERFLLPLLPCFALLAAHAAASAASWIGARSVARRAWIGALVLLPQALFGLRLARAIGSPDTITRCSRWIEDHVTPGSARLAVFNTIDLPLMRTEAALREDPGQLVDLTRPWLAYQGRLAPGVLADRRFELVTVPMRRSGNAALFRRDIAACVAEWNADYVILEVYEPGRRARFAELRDYLRSAGKRVARFSPYSDEARDQPFDYSEDRFGGFGWWTGHLLHADGFGPVVEVYRLR